MSLCGCMHAAVVLWLLHTGFAEGAQAGYEFGLVKSTLQVLAAHLAVEDSRRAKVGVGGVLQHLWARPAIVEGGHAS